MILVDTNVLCRLANRAHTDSAVARNALRTLRLRGEELAIVPQNLFEFWSVATRPIGRPPGGSNGLGLSVMITDKWLDYLQGRFILLTEGGQQLQLWRELVRTYHITGQKCHDTKLAAVMQMHQISRLLTFNGGDFRRYPFVQVIEPGQV